MTKKIEADHDTIQKLRQIFDTNSNKRILVLGTTCAGKTTLVKSLPECLDQDEICWALLPKELQEKLSKGSWTEEMIESWNKHVYNVTQTVEIEIGWPLFAGSIFKSDIVIYLNINEETLRERTKKRNIAYEAALKYDNEIKEKLKAIDLPVIVIDI
jgi:thymidylate kinase